MFAIQNIKTGKFVFGTDYRYYPPHQRTSFNQAVTYGMLAQAKSDFMHRGCGKDYRIVVLKTIEIKRIIDFKSDTSNELAVDGDRILRTIELCYPDTYAQKVSQLKRKRTIEREKAIGVGE